MRQEAIGEAGLRIGLGGVGERKDIGRLEEVEIRMAVARRLGEAMIEAAPPGTGHVRDDAVEDLAILFVAIEPVVQIYPQEAAALRHAKGQCPANRSGRYRPRL